MGSLPLTRLGRYDIVSLVGSGGMGEVYLARDERLGRDVAIKVLSARLGGDAEVRARFEREARAVARLSHPNIVAIHDVGEDAGVSYAVMEFLRGETLRDRLRTGPLSTELVREYGRQIAAALAAAHERGVVHRDLKPENIFLPAAGPLKLVDFGIARVADAGTATSDEAATSIGTRAGALLGTVEYMSPEQVRGEIVDYRSDLFSFGVVLYEMLGGARPFRGGSAAEIAASILTAAPSPVGPGGPAEDADLEQVALRCLAKVAEDRFGSAREIEEALRDRSSPTSAGQAPAPASREMARAVAVLPFADLSLDKSLEFFCDGVAEEIITELSRVPGLRVAARSSSFQFKGRTDDVRKMAQTLNVGTILEGSVRAAGERLRITAQLVDASEGYQVWSEKFDRRLDDIFAVQDEIARAVVAALAPPAEGNALTGLLGAGTADLEAYTLYLKGRHHWNKRTEPDLEAGLSYFQQAIFRDPSYAEAQGALAETYLTLGLYGARAPGEVMPQARAEADEALARQPGLPSALATAACVKAVFGWSWEEADVSFRRAIAASPAAPAAHHWYAINCLVPLGRFAEARAELALALAADPLSPAIVATLGIAAYLERRYDVAEAELRKAMALHSTFAMAHLFLGLTYLEAGRLDEAQAELATATHLAQGSPEMTSARGCLAARMGRRSEAMASLDELRQRSIGRYVSPVLTAQVQTALGDHDDALTSLERARDVRAADLAWLPARPAWDALRSTTRFEAILRTMNLTR